MIAFKCLYLLMGVFFFTVFYPFALVRDLNTSSTSAAQIVCDSVTAFSQYCAGPLAVYMSL